MTPAQANLIRATALSILAPGSGIYRDGVREALAVVDAETARGINAPRDDTAHLLATEANARRVMEDVGRVRTDALPIAEAVSRKILDRAAFGVKKYGKSLDDAGLDPAAWLLHLQEELLDAANYVESFRRAMRATPATAPVEPPHAVAPVLRPLTPEPAEAVLGRAGEALEGSLPVYVLAGTGRHPYGDDAWHMETDGVARLFPSKEAAQRWLAAMGRAPASGEAVPAYVTAPGWVSPGYVHPGQVPHPYGALAYAVQVEGEMRIFPTMHAAFAACPRSGEVA